MGQCGAAGEWRNKPPKARSVYPHPHLFSLTLFPRVRVDQTDSGTLVRTPAQVLSSRWRNDYHRHVSSTSSASRGGRRRVMTARKGLITVGSSYTGCALHRPPRRRKTSTRLNLHVYELCDYVEPLYGFWVTSSERRGWCWPQLGLLSGRANCNSAIVRRHTEAPQNTNETSKSTQI